MQGQYITSPADFVTIPINVARYAQLVSKSALGKISKPNLMREASLRPGLFIRYPGLKKDLIRDLLQYYKDHPKTVKFQHDVATAIQVRANRGGLPAMLTTEMFFDQIITGPPPTTTSQPVLSPLPPLNTGSTTTLPPLNTGSTTTLPPLNTGSTTTLPPLNTGLPPLPTTNQPVLSPLPLINIDHQGRDFVGIMPLKGKQLNVMNATGLAPVLSPLPPLNIGSPVLSPLPPINIGSPVLSPLPPLNIGSPVLSPLPPINIRSPILSLPPFNIRSPILSPLPPLNIGSPILSLPPLITGHPPIITGPPITGLPPIPTTLPTTLPPLPTTTTRFPSIPTEPLFKIPTTGIPEYTLGGIYSLQNADDARYVYRSLMGDPDAGARLSYNMLINNIVEFSDVNSNLHNDSMLRTLRELPESMLNTLIGKYKITSPPGTTKNNKALLLYRNGISFSDLMFAQSSEPDLIKGGNVSGKNGVYDKSGKVSRNVADNIDPIPGNPYSYLSARQLRQIANGRDIPIDKRKHQVVYISTLTNYDNILPEWKNSVIQGSIGIMDRGELYYLAGYNEINISKLDTDNMSLIELRELITLGKIVLNKNPPKPQRKIYQNYPDHNKELRKKTAYELSNDKGYILDIKNIGFNFSVFTHPKTHEETLGYFRELAVYPANISYFDYQTLSWSRPKIMRILLSMKYPDVNFMDRNHILFLASRGYIVSTVNIDKIKARYTLLRKYGPTIMNKLHRLYGIDRSDTSVYDIAREKKNPLEDIIVSFRSDRNEFDRVSTRTGQERNRLAPQYGARIGMIIPPSIQNKSEYFWDNVLDYKQVMTRPANIKPINKELLSIALLNNNDVRLLLQNYTDSEIFTYVGLYMPYTSRSDLVDNINSVRQNRRFFIPTIRNCTNEETITTLEDTIDPAVFIISYGTMFEYFCYDTDDFTENFRDFPIEGTNETIYKFRKPDVLEEDFVPSEMTDLMNLLELYPTIPGIREIIINIRDGLRKVRTMTKYDVRVKNEYNKLPNTDKPIINRWLKQLFTTGMYMRRWKGPPHPYPMKSKDTKGPDPNIQVNIELKILGYYPTESHTNKVGGITAELSKAGQKFVDNLRSVEYKLRDDVRKPTQQSSTIGYFLGRVRRQAYCIRMASTQFIGTGSYYLFVFFSETMPNFDPAELVTIM